MYEFQQTVNKQKRMACSIGAVEYEVHFSEEKKTKMNKTRGKEPGEQKRFVISRTAY